MQVDNSRRDRFMVILSNTGKQLYRNIRHALLKFQEHYQEDIPQIVRDFVYSPEMNDWRICVYATNDTYEYVVHLQRISDGETYEHIHIDGIQQDRDRCKDNTPDHPVFKITCLTDIVLEALMEGSDETPIVEESIINGWGK